MRALIGAFSGVIVAVFTFVLLVYSISFFAITVDLISERHKLKCPVSNRNIDIVFPVRPFTCWLIQPQDGK